MAGSSSNSMAAKGSPLKEASTDKKSHGDGESFKLRRHIGTFYGTCLVINMVVGSGIFAVPTGVLKYCNGNVVGSLIVWGVGGVFAMLCSLCIAELGSTISESGSWISFLYYQFGKLPSFVYAWLALIMAYPEGMAAQIAVIGEYITKVIFRDGCDIPNLQSAQKCFGISVFLIIVAINITNIKLAIKIQAFCAIAKTAALVGIIATGVVHIVKDSSLVVANLSPVSHGNQTFTFDAGVSGFGLALYQSMWAYNGYEAATWVTEEVKNPQRAIPLIMYLSMPLVLVLYISVNIAFLTVLTPEEMLSSRAVAVTFGQRVHPFMAYFMMISVCLSLVGTMNAALMVVGRLPFVSGRLGYMPEFLSMAHVKYVSPLPALLVITILALLMASSNSFDVLVVAKQFTEWGFKGLAFVGILYLRKKRPDLNRPYKMFTPSVVLAVFLAIFMVIIPLIFQPETLYLLNVPLLFVFAMMYFLTKKGILKMSGIGKVGIFIQKVLLVIPTSTDHVGLK